MDYEGRQGGGKSLVVMGKQRKDVAYQGRDQQRPLCISSRYVNWPYTSNAMLFVLFHGGGMRDQTREGNWGKGGGDLCMMGGKGIRSEP